MVDLLNGRTFLKYFEVVIFSILKYFNNFQTRTMFEGIKNYLLFSKVGFRISCYFSLYYRRKYQEH